MTTEDNFTLTNSNEIARKLMLIWKTGCLLTVSFNNRSFFFISTLIQVDTKKKVMSLDMSSQDELNKRLLKARDILFETKVEGVSVSFTLNKISKPLLGRSDSFLLSFPEQLIWQERRLFYRIRPLLSTNPHCKFTLQFKKGDKKFPYDFSFRIHDISLTGLSFIYHPDEYNIKIIELIKKISNSQVNLPEIGPFNINLEVCNRYPANPSKPDKEQIIGLKFHNITPSIETQIQRYMLLIQRQLRGKVK